MDKKPTADDFRVDDYEDVNLPVENDYVFEHSRWTDAVLKSEQLKAELQADVLEKSISVWEELGESALRQSKTESPVQFVRLIQGLLPKKVDIDVNASGTTQGNFSESQGIQTIRGIMDRIRQRRSETVIEGELVEERLPGEVEESVSNTGKD